MWEHDRFSRRNHGGVSPDAINVCGHRTSEKPDLWRNLVSVLLICQMFHATQRKDVGSAHSRVSRWRPTGRAQPGTRRGPVRLQQQPVGLNDRASGGGRSDFSRDEVLQVRALRLMFSTER